MRHRLLLACLALCLLTHCQRPGSSATETTATVDNPPEAPFLWRNATVYFLLTDRFYNADTTNDVAFGRDEETAVLRGFLGGDLKGVTQQLKAGYFDKLGVTALWMTPLVEQVHGYVDEGTGKTYGYHGYWAKDWTTLDPSFGTAAELQELVTTAHQHGIRVLLDVVVNHTGPVTPDDPAWPDAWVRQSPTCTYEGYETTVECTLVKNLPDVHTESESPVDLPAQLVQKWQAEGRLEQEQQELDAFFAATGYPRSPRAYLIKWLTDYVRELGVDGFRVDTAKHTEAGIWSELKEQAEKAFADWKAAHPADVLDDNDFFMVGEVYNYAAGAGRAYDYGDRNVDFFDNGFEALINFDFKYDAKQPYDAFFTKYDTLLHGGALDGVNVLNYLTSHDDGQPFDPDRSQTLETGTRLLLAQGAAQIYYGDESARSLQIPGTEGDATLRSFMNWEALRSDTTAKATFDHFTRLGQFRRAHPAVGAGRHRALQAQPYVFSRRFEEGGYTDDVVVALDLPIGRKTIPVGQAFAEGRPVKDYYSGKTAQVQDGNVTFDTPHPVLLVAAE
ncbi:alpha-amylase [Catalinimonas alkaloidigena]|uniref:Alpha-amylase n=1 Tax=Catalinimonas alkaloidigena TaxID=1075417 RepID=A0A1G9AAQ4_9BACT|nr:alpha-amylase family glycosyl hydrolase [Catalinimonas alkaloidigena]SDK24439.1 alpha-amylase [Catalinimonas alkaloidigena]